MDNTIEKRGAAISFEDVATGDASSLPSKVVFFLLCLIPIFSTLLFGGVDNITWALISVMWALLVLMWGAEAWRAGGLIINTSSLQIPLLGFLAIGLIQLLPLGSATGGLNVPGTEALSLDPYATRFFVTKLVVYATFFAACLTFINSEKRLKAIVWLIVVFASGMAFYGILQRLASPDGIYGVRQTAGAIPFGPFVNQHHFATFMQMAGGLALGLLFAKESTRERRILLAAAVVVMGTATVSTGSRGGLLGFVSVVAFVMVLNFLSGRWSGNTRSKEGSQRKIAIAAAGVGLLVVILGVVLLIGGNDSLLRGVGVVQADADISTGRLHFWPIAIKIFLEHPILGSGFESFGLAFTRYDTWSGQFRVEQAHNEYLQTLSDAGIAGFVCLAAFIFILFRKGLRTITQTIGFRNEAAVGALAGCLGVLVHSFFDFPLRTPSNAFFFLLLCSIATVAVATNERVGKRRKRSTEL